MYFDCICINWTTGVQIEQRRWADSEREARRGFMRETQGSRAIGDSYTTALKPVDPCAPFGSTWFDYVAEHTVRLNHYEDLRASAKVRTH